MKAHDIATQLVSEHASRKLLEADTRMQIIDPILIDILGWPRARLATETHIHPGFADYILSRADASKVIIIEAKREGRYFEIPQALADKSLSGYVKVRTLLTSQDINDAITQVRTYCLDAGCDTGAITNGHEWILFRAFQRDAEWRDLKAFAVFSMRFFSERFTEAHNHLSYESITTRGSLRRLLLDLTIHNRELFYPKARVPSFDATVNANAYASSLRPIGLRFFGTIDAGDQEFMDNCYVSRREYDLAFTNARRRLEDALTPYLEQYDIRNFKDSPQGGGFGNRLKKTVIKERAADVVVLFGGKGVGKSTFLHKLLFHRPPQILKKNAIVTLVDLLNTPPDIAEIRRAIWASVVAESDVDLLLNKDRDALCNLFTDRFEAAKRIDLFGLDPSSEVFNAQLNRLVTEWIADLPYVAERLADYWRRRHKALIVVIDNTDQLPESVQELCFSIAQEIAARLTCIAVISMREERFYASSIRGVLDAFQNSGFHISSPEPNEVFLRRIDYVLRLLQTDGDQFTQHFPERIDREVCGKLFRVLATEFNADRSHLANFLTACSHGNIRLALELFRGFLESGYTNVNEMTTSDWWTLQIHQVIKPFMIPNRFFYDEQTSLIPNLFQIRSKVLGSHFTATRILRRLEPISKSLNYEIGHLQSIACCE